MKITIEQQTQGWRITLIKAGSLHMTNPDTQTIACGNCVAAAEFIKNLLKKLEEEQYERERWWE